jgi:leader peptidase (prepilin peptidase) / N-methyltransferase
LTGDRKIGTIETNMEIYLIIIFGLFGAAVGSFLNVCADRLPAEKSLLSPPSHCDACGHRLSALDLFPVFSYIFLRGRCRYCGVRIPIRGLIVELGCGLFTAFLFWKEGLTLQFAVIALYSYIYIVIALIDLSHQLILNKIVYPSLIAALIIAPFFVEGGNLAGGQFHFGNIHIGILNALIAGLVGFVFLLIPAIVSRGGMGFGDVKMAALIGLTTGFPGVLVAIIGGIILGGLVAIILLAFRIRKRKEVIPFGPFLSLASIVTLIWGSQIFNWYMTLFKI